MGCCWSDIGETSPREHGSCTWAVDSGESAIARNGRRRVKTVVSGARSYRPVPGPSERRTPPKSGSVVGTNRESRVVGCGTN